MVHIKIEIKSEEINHSNTVIASLITVEVIFGEDQRRRISFDSRKKQKIRIGRIKLILFLKMMMYQENNA